MKKVKVDMEIVNMDNQDNIRLLNWKLMTNSLPIGNLTIDEEKTIQTFRNLLVLLVSQDEGTFPFLFQLKKTQFVKLARDVWAIYYNNGGVYNNHIFDPLLSIKFYKKEGCGKGYDVEEDDEGNTHCVIDLYYNLRQNVRGKWKIVKSVTKKRSTRKKRSTKKILPNINL